MNRRIDIINTTKCKKATLYICKRYDENGMEKDDEQKVFHIHKTSPEDLKPYMNKNWDIYLGRHNKCNGRVYIIDKFHYGDEV